jgi:hypothetical protein
MELKEIPRVAWLVVAAALLIAMMHLPYGYYTFTHILTCGFCTLIAVLICIATAFNPFIPLRLSRFTWPYLDLGAAIVLGVHLFLVRQKLA